MTLRSGRSLPHRLSTAPDVLAIGHPRLRQLPANPSGPVQHASFLQVGVLLTGRAVLWRLTTCRVLDRDRRQSEDVFSHQITVASKQQYPCARTDARRYC